MTLQVQIKLSMPQLPNPFFAEVPAVFPDKPPSQAKREEIDVTPGVKLRGCTQEEEVKQGKSGEGELTWAIVCCRNQRGAAERQGIRKDNEKVFRLDPREITSELRESIFRGVRGRSQMMRC